MLRGRWLLPLPSPLLSSSPRRGSKRHRLAELGASLRRLSFTPPIHSFGVPPSLSSSPGCRGRGRSGRDDDGELRAAWRQATTSSNVLACVMLPTPVAKRRAGHKNVCRL